MNYPLLSRFIIKSASHAPAPQQEQLISLLNQLQGQNGAAPDADLNGTPGQALKGPEDALMNAGLPEMHLENPEKPTVFGKSTSTGITPLSKVSMWSALTNTVPTPQIKQASSFIKDVKLKDLPSSVREEVLRFIPSGSDERAVVQYGMVVSELEKLVDPHNYQLAQKYVKGTKVSYEDVYNKLHTKYVLMVNHRVVDGHTFMAKAKKVGLGNSINVLDLTPARFQ